MAIPNKYVVAIGQESSFGTGAGSYMEIKPWGYSRFNPSVEYISFADRVRNHLGVVGGMAGAHNIVEGSLSFKLHGHGQDEITGSPPTWNTYWSTLLTASGFEAQKAFKGATVDIDSTGTFTVVNVDSSSVSDYPVGGFVIIKSGAVVVGAFIQSVADDGVGGVNLTLDRNLGINTTGTDTLLGAYTYTLNTASVEQFSTDGSLKTFSLYQESIDGEYIGMFGGITKELAITSEARALLDATLSVQFHDSDTGTSRSYTSWSDVEYIVGTNAQMAIVTPTGAVEMTEVGKVELKVSYEVKPITAIDGAEGRKGWIVTSVTPTITVEVLHDDDTITLPSLFEGNETFGISIHWNNPPTAGRSFGIYIPSVQLTSEWNVSDGDLQVYTIEAEILHTSDGDLMLTFA